LPVSIEDLDRALMATFATVFGPIGAAAPPCRGLRAIDP
jgi:hypothetical protein